MNRRWVCNDVWMDMFPFFDRPQLGLNLALLSFRFDVLVDAHFGGKTTELTVWREIAIRKDEGQKAKLVPFCGNFVSFPLPDRPLPNKIRFNSLWIDYIDHSVIEFLSSNKQIWDRSGSKLELLIANIQSIWDVFARQIWPIFTTSIRHLYLNTPHSLDNLRRHISPTILTDLDQLNSITSNYVLPEGIADDEPNATSGQALSTWLHTPTKNGQSKRLLCNNYTSNHLEWINNFKEKFFRATTTSVCYQIRFGGILVTTTLIEPFELVNERTNEKLTLTKDRAIFWLLKRCPIIRETAAGVQKPQKDEYLEQSNRVVFHLFIRMEWEGADATEPAVDQQQQHQQQQLARVRQTSPAVAPVAVTPPALATQMGADAGLAQEEMNELIGHAHEMADDVLMGQPGSTANMDAQRNMAAAEMLRMIMVAEGEGADAIESAVEHQQQQQQQHQQQQQLARARRTSPAVAPVAVPPPAPVIMRFKRKGADATATGKKRRGADAAIDHQQQAEELTLENRLLRERITKLERMAADAQEDLADEEDGADAAKKS